MRPPPSSAIGFALAVFFFTCAKAEDAKTVTVAQDKSSEFKTIQAAIDSIPKGNAIVRIKPGIYKERVRIPASKPNFPRPSVARIRCGHLVAYRNERRNRAIRV